MGMENLLLRYIRQKACYSPEQAAVAAGIDQSTYLAIERGELPLSTCHAETLGQIFDMDPKVLHAASLQLEMLRTNDELLKRQNYTIEILTALVKLLRPSKGKAI
jgi:DNA-binding XRE family transcriptional regulator